MARYWACRCGGGGRTPRCPHPDNCDTDDPLLVSVRSGAALSMPGMMNTILNLGLNDESVVGLANATGNARFAYGTKVVCRNDCWSEYHAGI